MINAFTGKLFLEMGRFLDEKICNSRAMKVVIQLTVLVNINLTLVPDSRFKNIVKTKL